MALPTITAIGNLTFDPDFQVTANGFSRCRLRMACNERKKQDGEWVDGEPTFLDVTLWRGLAEAAGDNFKKGQAIMVTGKLKVRNYEDKNGLKATSVEIEATDIALVVKPSKSAPVSTDDPWIQGDEHGCFCFDLRNDRNHAWSNVCGLPSCIGSTTDGKQSLAI